VLALYNKDFKTRYGTINSVIEAFVEEERNGLFELSFIMLNTDSLFQYIKEDNIVVANANNTLLNQKFRIYMTRKLMNNRVEVFARHISFDLMYDYVDNISFENQSCEYGLNQLFRNSQFSSHYKGYSNIINAQNYSMSMVNILEAIGGKEGSLLDTFGTGAELLRDNENIHILNKRGHDNSVSIEYKKNLTGFELEEDTTELITRILPYAKYTPKDSEGNSLEETTIKGNFVDSPLLANYSHPFVKAIDYTDKFEEGEEVTSSKLASFAQNEYKFNNVDKPKQNFKIEFMPLSKCIGYEGLEDNISLCDTVTIKDTRYNINTQAKVIKTTFNVLKNRFESMELGEPKTSLGDIIGNNDSTKGEKGDKGDKGDKGEDGSIGDFPNSLPSVPVVTAKVYGFANIEISWTFESKVYYQYEVYASKEANFTPNTFNLVHKGQTSTYMHQAKPNETWYFKVCAINSHNNRTSFGSSYVSTTKVDDLSNYVGEMAIDEALIGTLSLDRGWVGTLKGNYIDARQLSVTNGNGVRTLDIDSNGNVSLNVNSLSINSSNVATKSEVTQTVNNSISNIEIGGRNLLINSNVGTSTINYMTKEYLLGNVKPIENEIYTMTIKGKLGEGRTHFGIYNSGGTVPIGTLKSIGNDLHQWTGAWKISNGSITSLNRSVYIYQFPNTVTSKTTIEWVKLEKGNKATDWTPATEDVDSSISNVQNNVNTLDNKLTNNYSTTTQMNSAVNLKANEITSSVSATYTTKSEFNSLSIGGTNIFTGGENVRSTNRFIEYKTSTYLSDYIDQRITISFDCKLNDGGISRELRAYPYQSNGISINNSYYFTPTTEWKRYYFSATVKDWGIIDETYTTGGIAFYDYTGNNNYSVRRFKIELGNKATDWSPSIEDTDNKLLQYEQSINANIDNAVQQGTTELLTTVEGLYAKKDTFESFQSTVSSRLDQTSKDIQMTFSEAITATNVVNNNLETYKAEVATNIRFDTNGIELGKTNSPFKSKLTNTKLAFTQNDNEVAYISNNKMYITEAQIVDNMMIGKFIWDIGANGNLTLKWSE